MEHPTKAFNVNIGYARSVYSAAVEYVYDCGRYTLKSELDGIHYFVDGKPHYTGREN